MDVFSNTTGVSVVVKRVINIEIVQSDNDCGNGCWGGLMAVTIVIVLQICHQGALAHRQVSIEVMRHIGSLLHLSQRRACTSQTGYLRDICKYCSHLRAGEKHHGGR